jgi:parallel beta-helix repeat protein
VTISRSGTLTKPIEFRSNGAVIENAAGYGIYLKRVSYVTLDGFKVQNTKLKGIAARDATPTSPVHGLTIRNCTIKNTRQEGMYLSEVADSLIEGNTITNTGLEGVETTGHGIYLANGGSDGTTIRRNIIMIGASKGSPLHINGDLSTGGDGIVNRVTIDSNILSGGTKGVSGDGVQDGRIVNNLIYGTRQHGIRLYREDGAAGAKGFVIINNTIQAPNAALKATDEVGSSIAFNNILADGKEASVLTGQLSTNLKTFAVTADYAPTSTAKDKGVLSFGGQNAPTTDISGAARSKPVSIGAFE